MSNADLQAMPNERQGIPMRVEHSLLLPRACPISRNPQPGSTLTIRYRAGPFVLEVYALKAYVQTFVGGHADGTRNMESMIQKIAQDCAQALQVPVRVIAELVLVPHQHMRITCKANPNDVLFGQSPGALVGLDQCPAVRIPPPTVLPEEFPASDCPVGPG